MNTRSIAKHREASRPSSTPMIYRSELVSVYRRGPRPKPRCRWQPHKRRCYVTPCDVCIQTFDFGLYRYMCACVCVCQCLFMFVPFQLISALSHEPGPCKTCVLSFTCRLRICHGSPQLAREFGSSSPVSKLKGCLIRFLCAMCFVFMRVPQTTSRFKD